MTGARHLLRLALRRDRVLLPVWVLAIAGLAHAVLRAVLTTHATEADRVTTATLSAANPLSRVFDGPASGTTVGALAFVEGYKGLGVLVAIMAAQVVIRHTRADEEAGRTERVRSAAVSRSAPLAVAVTVALGACVITGVAVAVAIGLSGVGWTGAWAAGLAVAGTGCVFAGFGAVAAQVFSTTRGANGAVAGAVGGAYALRAVGDLTGHLDTSGVVVVSTWPSWLSPLGWAQQIRPFYANHWWIAALFAAATALLVLAAAALAAHRDAGAGFIATRRGPDRAPAGLPSTLGLAWRLQRPVLGVWLAAMTVAGAAFGSVGDTLADQIMRNDAVRRLLEATSPGAAPLKVYQAFLMALLGIVGAGYPVQAALRLRDEETSGRLEAVLACAVGRARLLGSHVLVICSGTVAIFVACGLASGLTHGATSGSWADGMRGLLTGALVQIPAALVMAGLAVATFGLLPRWSGPIVWDALAAALVVWQLGEVLSLPVWVVNLSPFTHVPAVPAESAAVAPLLWLVAAAVALAGAGLAAFLRRDVQGA